MNRWNICAAFRSPNVIAGNSKCPNGVIIIIFATSTGIWWYARSRLLLRKQFSARDFVRNLQCVGLETCLKQYSRLILCSCLMIAIRLIRVTSTITKRQMNSRRNAKLSIGVTSP